jgi:iron complex outermembrane receptor protein
MMRAVVMTVLALAASASAAIASGRIEGRLQTPDGRSVPGVAIVVVETSATAVSDANGSYSFDALPAGRYTLTFSLADNSVTRSDVAVTDGTATPLDLVLDWALRFSDTITVYGASRHTERLVEAPASVSVISAERIADESTQGQLPKLLESAPGVEVVQSGVFDYSLNVRGFNAALNRRVLVLVDGRDMGGVLSGAHEWGASGVQADDLAKIELIRGPGSALYGSNAFNGVVNFISKEPRYAQGGDLHLAFGERATAMVSGSHAGRLSPTTYFRVFGEAMRTNDFYQSRATSVEYPGIPTEAIAPPLDHTSVLSGGARLDRYFGDGRLLTVEGGESLIGGHVFLTALGRTQDDAVWRPWLRSSYTAGGWSASGYFNGRSGTNVILPSGVTGYDHSYKLHAEALRRLDLPAGKGQVIGGGAFTYDSANSKNPAGVETVFYQSESAQSGAVFGQLDYNLTPALKSVLAMRVDRGTLYATQLSPKAGLVYAVRPDQTLRFSYGHAFQSASFLEYFARVDAAPPVDLSPLERALAPVIGTTPLGFASVPVLLVGNQHLKVETVGSFEVGYTGVLARRAVVTADYYHSRLENFISSALPQVGTSLGRLNPDYGPYQPPSALNAPQQAILLATLQSALPATLYPALSNDLNGSPAFIVASQTNFGQVDTQGIDLGVQYMPLAGLAANLNYSWFDFTVKRDLPDAPIQSNSSPHRVYGGISYGHREYTASLQYRWTDRFKWAQGLLIGDVPSYSVVDVALARHLTKAISVRLDVANLLDNRHYEVFGGDLLRRRALLDLICRW